MVDSVLAMKRRNDRQTRQTHRLVADGNLCEAQARKFKIELVCYREVGFGGTIELWRDRMGN